MLETYSLLENITKDDVINQACMFDFISLQKLLGNLNDNCQDVNVFKKPYIFFKLDKIYESYLELETISNNFRNKNNLLFVISEYNRQQIGLILTQYHFRKLIEQNYGKQEVQRITISVKQININYLLDNYLTSDEQNIIKKKLNGDNFIYYKNKILKLIDDVNKKIIFTSGINQYQIDLFKDYVLNYLFIENNNSYQELLYYTIKTIFLDNQNIKENNNQDCITKNHFFIEETKEREFHYFDMYLMIEYLSIKQFSEIINTIDTISISSKQQLLLAYKNLINSISKFKYYNNYKFVEYLRKFFIIFSKIEFDKSEFSEIINFYLKFLKQYKIYLNDTDLYRFLMDFIIIQYNDSNRRQNINVECLKLLLSYIYKKTIKCINENTYFIRNSLCRVVNSLSNIIQFFDKNYVIDIEGTNIIEDISYFRDFYIPMYSIIDKRLKRKIKKSIITFLNTDFNVELFYDASMKEIIQSDIKYEELLLQQTEDRIRNYFNLKENPRTEEHDGKIWKILPTKEKQDAENAISIIADLINFGIIKNNNLYLNLLQYSDFKEIAYLSFVSDMHNFDYNKFEVSYIHFLTPRKMKELKSIVKNDKNIRCIIKEKVLNQININSKYNDIYMKNKIFSILFNEPFENLD